MISRFFADSRTVAVIAARWKMWAVLVGIAVGGSCLYGASLSLALPGWQSGAAALWLAVSAGASWGVFIPALSRATRRPLVECFDRCLVTMAFGEVVLTSGALVNLLLWHLAVMQNAAAINGGIVSISNVVMAAALAGQMRRVGVPVRTTIALWMLVLNGCGAAFFWLLYRPLHGA